MPQNPTTQPIPPNPTGPTLPPRYFFSQQYLAPHRLGAYGEYYKALAPLAPQRILEIGPGNGLFTHLLHHAGLAVTTLDPDPGLHPSVVAALPRLPFADNAFDLLCAFQVLEHLPFEQLAPSLADIRRVTSRYALLSLPDILPFFRCDLHLPLLGDLHLHLDLPYRLNTRPRIGHEHFWEINMRPFPLRRVRSTILDAGFTMHHSARLRLLPYQRLFVLEKR